MWVNLCLIKIGIYKYTNYAYSVSKYNNYAYDVCFSYGNYMEGVFEGWFFSQVLLVTASSFSHVSMIDAGGHAA